MKPTHLFSMFGRLFPLFVVTALAGAPGCVKQGLYDAALADIANRDTRLTDQEAAIASCRSELAVRSADLDRCSDDSKAIGSERDHLLAEMASLRGALRREGADKAAAAEQADALARSLSEAQRALEELRARQAEARERDRIYEGLLERFRAMIDAGTLDVAIEAGRIVIKMRQDILFDSGSAKVNRDGKDVLAEVATALAELTDRRFQVEGHTDNVPIATERFPSNWELSTARATAVVKLLAHGGVSPVHLSAAGYGEFQPRASNEEADGRALNRRIAIVMQPEIQPLPDLE